MKGSNYYQENNEPYDQPDQNFSVYKRFEMNNTKKYFQPPPLPQIANKLNICVEYNKSEILSSGILFLLWK